MTNILVVDDHAIVRVGFRHLIETFGDYLVFESGTGEEAYRAYPDCMPALVIMDIEMPGYGGLEATRRLCARYPDARVIMLTAYDSPVYAERSREAGALAYLPKHAAPAQLDTVMRQVLAGETVFPKVALRRDADGRIAQLSGREFEIFRLLAEGVATAGVADLLKISPKTVSNHRSAIFDKLGVDNLSDLTRLAIRGSVVKA